VLHHRNAQTCTCPRSISYLLLMLEKLRNSSCERLLIWAPILTFVLCKLGVGIAVMGVRIIWCLLSAHSQYTILCIVIIITVGLFQQHLSLPESNCQFKQETEFRCLNGQFFVSRALHWQQGYQSAPLPSQAATILPVNTTIKQTLCLDVLISLLIILLVKQLELNCK
jgi:hypothetical protein